MGNTAGLHEGEIAGVIPRTLQAVFGNADPSCVFHVSFLEIYNESLRDLLPPQGGGAVRGNLQLREGGDGSIQVTGTEMHKVRSVEEALELLVHGDSLRATAATQMNEHSSRSHSIFTVHMQRTCGMSVLCSKFHMVDLAGSERNKRTGNQGVMFKESVGINSGLFALGKVVSALSSKPRASHIPYRDSRLTRLLQDSLGGNSRTLLVACIGPARTSLEETLYTLNYATRACAITNVPEVTRQELEVLQRQQSTVFFGGRRQCHEDSPSPMLGEADTALRARVVELEQELERQRTEACIPYTPNEALRARIEQLEDDLEKKKLLGGTSDDVEALRAKVASLEHELGEARQDLAADEGIWEENLAKTRKWKKRALAAEQELERVRQHTADDRTQAHEWERRCSELQQELERTQRESGEAARRAVAGWKQRCAELDQQLSVVRDAEVEERRRAATLERYCDELKQQLESARGAVEVAPGGFQLPEEDRPGSAAIMPLLAESASPESGIGDSPSSGRLINPTVLSIAQGLCKAISGGGCDEQGEDLIPTFGTDNDARQLTEMVEDVFDGVMPYPICSVGSRRPKTADASVGAGEGGIVDVNKLQHDNAALEKECSVSRQRHSELENEIRSLGAQAAVATRLTYTNAELERELQSVKVKYHQLEEHLWSQEGQAALTKECETLRARHQEMQAVISNLRRGGAEAEQLRSQKDDLERECYYYKQTNKKLKDKLRAVVQQQQQNQEGQVFQYFQGLESPPPVQRQEREERQERGDGGSLESGGVQKVEKDVSRMRKLTPEEVEMRRARTGYGVPLSEHGVNTPQASKWREMAPVPGF
eukprot:Hpha_TRINITY_DN16802_c2_g3::TRINITY_DN16802_c2_g3_i1::g.151081::m.151081/K10395/KIF4_21_27; kinesin family member 4/21/27